MRHVVQPSVADVLPLSHPKKVPYSMTQPASAELTGTWSEAEVWFWSANVRYTQFSSCVGAYTEEPVSMVASDAMLGAVAVAPGCPGAMNRISSLQLNLNSFPNWVTLVAPTLHV